MLELLGADLEEALERLNLPAYFVDESGRIRWQNAAAVALIGERSGTHFSSVLAPEYAHEAQQAFSRKLLGSEESVDREWVVIGLDGSRTRVVTSGVPLRSSRRAVGVFGVVRVIGTERPRPPRPHLTPRQFETLRMLAAGLSTAQIARQLGITPETTRGHIRRLLAALDAHSRLEAVARGRELDLI